MVRCEAKMSSKQHDTNEPILLLVRRGRRGKGFLVSAADDHTNPAACADAEEIGGVIEEMLDDPEQPRFDMDALAGGDAAPEAPATGGEIEEYEGDDEDEDEDEGEADPMMSGLDPLERLALQVGKKLLDKGREVSNGYRRKGRRRRQH